MNQAETSICFCINALGIEVFHSQDAMSAVGLWSPLALLDKVCRAWEVH